ncbi:MAG: DUF4442 domain-containing protein [Thalassobium sp.]|jgi:acyl-coenzyme A thioesterase PaaI-like protein|nr:translation elongation factor P (EF-P) [Thalassolituus oleivorans R6-15]MBQ0728633.1 DUF4442 domain-containing protein [Thalassolituus oleivorans]MCA6127205.1 hypothetical protein [Thalassolituus oleivorans 4BN06-13]PCI48800.1 MAG: DUF4442 domain-containing protein [Oceanospirillales bacterium]PHQ87786.1 MAG: DUF4442 domain-containing protein [Thalassobium sp.]|tara:strand:+ start:402 stop:881 length:480 start_codon:yes stop_codon:yes gene_type:complete
MKRAIMRWLSSPRIFRHTINLFTPYIGAGIKATYLSPDYREIHVQMKLRWYNRNYVGTHFGGSIFAMTDPFYMLLFMNILGPKYIVWDKGADIDFVAPGKGTISVRFIITDAMLDEVLAKTANGEKFEPTYEVHVIDEAGELVASVQKRLYIRKHPRHR